MPTRDNLVVLANQLRHARTRLLSIEFAERVQHTIVRVEALLASPVLDTDAADAVAVQAKQLLAECDALLPKR